MSAIKGIITGIKEEFSHHRYPEVRVVVLKTGRRLYQSEGRDLGQTVKTYDSLREAVDHLDRRP